MKRWPILLLTLVLAACTTTALPKGESAQSDYPDLGQAPDLSGDTWLNTTEALRLANLRAKVVLLDMWPTLYLIDKAGHIRYVHIGEGDYDETETAIRSLLEAIFVASLDHGPAAPSASSARMAASTGAPLNGAMAAGLLSINRFHGGAIGDCMERLQQGVADAKRLGQTGDEAASALVAAALAAKNVLPGFGHRVHTRDPRTTRLFALAADAGLDGDYVAMARFIQKALAAAGKDLPINVDGAIAAMLCQLGFPPALGNVFFMVGRLPGMAAQAYEEMTTQKPMRRIDFQACRYDGPPDRPLPG